MKKEKKRRLHSFIKKIKLDIDPDGKIEEMIKRDKEYQEKTKKRFGWKILIIMNEKKKTLRERFNTERFHHVNDTSWLNHQYEQETYKKCTYTENCRFCEKIKKGETITEEDKIDAFTIGF
jgi:hypothetical protein